MFLAFKIKHSYWGTKLIEIVNFDKITVWLERNLSLICVLVENSYQSLYEQKLANVPDKKIVMQVFFSTAAYIKNVYIKKAVFY